jgi:peptidoglycan/LPS O-acetylase OafA/YrhL
MIPVTHRELTPGCGAPPPRRSARRARYWPGLDGLRGLAVLAVVVYHLAPGALPGGFLGVDVFFVISGYLITTLLVDEWRRRRRVDLLQFWRRRIRRLYPAVVALVVVLVPIMAIWDPSALASSRLTVPIALIYLTNWWFIFHHVSYFASFGPPSPLLHLWTLAIEEQYYLVWPPILVALLARWGKPARIALVALAGAIVSSVLMALLYHGAGSLDRIYYGSDTHAEGLLLGSALGLGVPPWGLPGRVTERARRILDRSGAVALGGLLVLTLFARETDTFTWRGGVVLAVVCAGAAVLVAAHPASRWSTVLGAPHLRGLGLRSYSVYVWHWPIIVLTEAGGAFPVAGVPGFVLRVVLIAAFSEASYRYVERPWRTGRAQRFTRDLLARSVRARRTVAASSAAAAVLVVVLLLVASAPPLPEATKVTATPAARRPVAPPPAARPAGVPLGLLGLAGRGAPGPRLAAGGRPVVVPADGGGPVLALGDSVMLAAAGDLTTVFGPTVTVDAVVGRQVGDGLERLAAYRSAGRLRGLRALVVGLGSNGPFTASDLARLRSLVAGVPLVVLVNVRVPDPWQAESDQTIASAASLPGFRVVDWYAASGAPGVLWPDHVHPDPAGQQLYAHLVARAVTGT